MKRNIKLIILSSILLIITFAIATSLFILNDRQFMEKSELEYSINLYDSNNSSVAVIGDSWVADNKLDEHIEKHVENINVKSIGFSGFRTQMILDKFDDSKVLNILNDKSIEKVIIIAGVNDSAGYYGSNYYSQHIIEMVKIINEFEKTAVLVELPEYGIEESRPLISSLKSGTYRYLFDKGNVDIIQEYRDTLTSRLSLTELDYEIMPFDSVATDYHDSLHLYKNFSHLNESGNELLGKEIALFINSSSDDQ